MFKVPYFLKKRPTNMSKPNNCVGKFKILMESFMIKLLSNINQMATMRGDEHFKD